MECLTTIASTIGTCALAGDACAVVACVQDEIGSTNDCYDCVCFAVDQSLGSMCDTCSGSPILVPHCDLLWFTFLAFLTMKLYNSV